MKASPQLQRVSDNTSVGCQFFSIGGGDDEDDDDDDDDVSVIPVSDSGSTSKDVISKHGSTVATPPRAAEGLWATWLEDEEEERDRQYAKRQQVAIDEKKIPEFPACKLAQQPAEVDTVVGSCDQVMPDEEVSKEAKRGAPSRSRFEELNAARWNLITVGLIGDNDVKIQFSKIAAYVEKATMKGSATFDEKWIDVAPQKKSKASRRKKRGT